MNKQFLPRRELGRTGFHVTRLGIGDVADRSLPIEQCVATLQRALDAGVNLVDTAPGYEDGYSEEIVGLALRGRNSDVFVIDKIDHLDRDVGQQVDESLARLQMTRVDALVLHGLSDRDKWNTATGPGGALSQLESVVSAGKARFRGISSHDPEVLEAALLSGLCDIVMFAIGPYCDRRYVTRILPLAKERGVGTVCFKTFGAGKLLGDTKGYNQPMEERPRGKYSSGGQPISGEAVLPCLSVEECLHYTLTCDPDVALLGMSYPNEQDAAFMACQDFLPLSPDRMRDIERRAEIAIEGKGPCWWNPSAEL